MLFKQRGHRRGLVPLVALLLPLALVACGVPISEAEVAATAERQQQAAVLGVQIQPLATQSSGRTSELGTSDVAVRSLVASPAADPGQRVASAATPRPSATPATDATRVATANAATSQGSATPTTTGTPATATAAATGTPATATPTPSATAAAAVAASGSSAGFASEALTILNAERARLGLRSVAFNGQLAAAAATYARYMATANFFGHDGPDGSSPNSRALAAGYRGSWRGETLAAGQTSPPAAIQVWLNSPPHRVIILDPSITEVGIGYYFEAGDLYGHYWVLQSGAQ